MACPSCGGGGTAVPIASRVHIPRFAFDNCFVFYILKTQGLNVEESYVETIMSYYAADTCSQESI